MTAAEAKLLSLGQDMYRWVNGLLHCWVLMTDKQVTLLAAAVGSRDDSSPTSSSSSSSSSVDSHSNALCQLLASAVGLELLYGVADMPCFCSRLPALNAWREHNVAVVAMLERLIRTALAPAISSGLGASAQHQQLPLLRKHKNAALTQLLKCRDGVEGTPLTLEAACCAAHGVELRRNLFALALSHFKLSGLQGRFADGASILALTQHVVCIGCFLATTLQEDYTLAAVRAAVAPWLVLVGRLYRLLAELLCDKITAATALLAHGSASNESAADALLGAVYVLVRAAALSLLRVQNEMMGCFMHPAAEQYKGTSQYPDPEAAGKHYPHNQQQLTHSSGSVADGCVSVHHLQHPGLAVEKVVSLHAAAAAGTVADDTNGAAASSSSSVMTVECVLLDDLDSWVNSEVHNSLFQRAAAALNTLRKFLQYSAQKAGSVPDQESSDYTVSRPPPLAVLRSVLEQGLLQLLPELLHADGTALCNLLPVPWCCNNPGCSNMGCDSEMVLVGGKACCCASCKVLWSRVSSCTLEAAQARLQEAGSKGITGKGGTNSTAVAAACVPTQSLTAEQSFLLTGASYGKLLRGAGEPGWLLAQCLGPRSVNFTVHFIRVSQKRLLLAVQSGPGPLSAPVTAATGACRRCNMGVYILHKHCCMVH